MKWSYWIELYIRTHCVARGLRPLTIAAYDSTLKQFRDWIRIKEDREPDQLSARDVLAYVQYLREVRDNGDSAINRTVVVLRRFYAAMVAMGQLDHHDNPLASFPSIKKCEIPARKGQFISGEESEPENQWEEQFSNLDIATSFSANNFKRSLSIFSLISYVIRDSPSRYFSWSAKNSANGSLHTPSVG